MYEDFVKTQNVFKDKKELDSDGSQPASSGKTMHIFQALQYIRKLCNHPLLVLSPKHANYNKYIHQIGGEQNIRQINNAPKLAALKQLLNDCGIGAEQESENDPLLTGAVSQHRALIFCQLKSMLDIVENDLLKTHLPSVTYLRLDGSVEANSRHDIVQKFNRDPSIDVLLLTTQVGGLGLNLTGADTVIFVEHDWNPMKDLQAMDRAHRLGQRKVVNVYRLIARGTLEEKIMGLQKFKLNIANSIVNQQNSGLSSMDTDQLLDLFKVPAAEGSTAQKAKQKALDKDGGDSHQGLGAAGKIIENLDQLWDDQQYKEEFDLDQFISNLPESQK
jgi:TATA-binding protein-associated factor